MRDFTLDLTVLNKVQRVVSLRHVLCALSSSPDGTEKINKNDE